MAAPKHIRKKAEALSRALNQVAKLSNEIEAWYAKKSDDYAATEFYSDMYLDNPWEFDLEGLLEELDWAADGNPSYVC